MSKIAFYNVSFFGGTIEELMQGIQQSCEIRSAVSREQGMSRLHFNRRQKGAMEMSVEETIGEGDKVVVWCTFHK